LSILRRIFEKNSESLFSSFNGTLVMYDLLDMSGTVKGNVGEELFVSLNRYVHRAEFGAHEWLEKLPIVIPKNHKDFLVDNWGTIDVFEFVVENNQVVNIIIYEVKTSRYRNKRQDLTRGARRFYQECISQGYKVVSVLVYLAENWKFEIICEDFDEKKYRISDGGGKMRNTTQYLKLLRRSFS